MNPEQFFELLQILSECHYHPEFRPAFITYLISHGLRPAFGCERGISDYLLHKTKRDRLNSFFERHDLPLRATEQIVYNTQIYQPDQILQKPWEDASQYFGRIFGYPEIFSLKDWDEVYQNLNKFHKVSYSVKYQNDLYWVNGWEFRWKKHNHPKNLPNYSERIYHILKPLGIQAVIKNKQEGFSLNMNRIRIRIRK